MRKEIFLLLVNHAFAFGLGSEQMFCTKKNVYVNLGFSGSEVCTIQDVQVAAKDPRSVFYGVGIDPRIIVRRSPMYGLSVGLGVSGIEVIYLYSLRHQLNFIPEPDRYFRMMDGTVIRKVNNGGYIKEIRILMSLYREKIFIEFGHFKYRFYFCEEGDWSIETDHQLGSYVNFDQFFKGISLGVLYRYRFTSTLSMENQVSLYPIVTGRIRFWNAMHNDVYRQLKHGLGGNLSSFVAYRHEPMTFSFGVFSRMIEFAEINHAIRSQGLTLKVDFTF